MKKKLFVRSALLCAALLLAGCASKPVVESSPDNSLADAPENWQDAADFKTTVADGQVTIVGYIGTTKDVRIPGRIDGLPVTAIGAKTFLETPLTSVTIPSSVTSIGEWAFAGSHITSVTISESVTSIGEYAFRWTALTNVIIPNGVTTIGMGAFANSTALTSVTMGNGVTTIGGEAFVNNTALTSVTMGNGVTSIGVAAFAGTQLTSITIGNSVTSIGVGAFDNGVTVIQNKRTISGTQDGLVYILLNKKIAIWKYTGDAETVIIPAKINGSPVTSIGNQAFSGTPVTSVTIPASVTDIGGDAFDEGVQIIRK